MALLLGLEACRLTQSTFRRHPAGKCLGHPSLQTPWEQLRPGAQEEAPYKEADLARPQEVLYKEVALARPPAEVPWSSSVPQAGPAAVRRSALEEVLGRPHATHAGVVEQAAPSKELPLEQIPVAEAHPAEAVEAGPL